MSELKEIDLDYILSKYNINDLSKLPKDIVGPVLTKDDLSYLIVEAIAIDNPKTFVGVIDRGSYIRVVGDRELDLNKDTLERLAGRVVRFPGEVEVRMSAFAGKIRVTGSFIKWYLEM
jgi:toluene monooxygenase system protein D